MSPGIYAPDPKPDQNQIRGTAIFVLFKTFTGKTLRLLFSYFCVQTATQVRVNCVQNASKVKKMEIKKRCSMPTFVFVNCFKNAFFRPPYPTPCPLYKDETPKKIFLLNERRNVKKNRFRKTTRQEKIRVLNDTPKYIFIFNDDPNQYTCEI